jgi:hypothetical protein
MIVTRRDSLRHIELLSQEHEQSVPRGFAEDGNDVSVQSLQNIVSILSQLKSDKLRESIIYLPS